MNETNNRKPSLLERRKNPKKLEPVLDPMALSVEVSPVTALSAHSSRTAESATSGISRVGSNRQLISGRKSSNRQRFTFSPGFSAERNQFDLPGMLHRYFHLFTVCVKRNTHLIPFFCGPLGAGGQKFTWFIM